MGHYACDMRPEWFGANESAISAAKKTRWFAGKEKPGRVGWYEVKCRHGRYGKHGELLFWDAYVWRLSDNTLDHETSFGQSCDKWRGLVSRA